MNFALSHGGQSSVQLLRYCLHTRQGYISEEDSLGYGVITIFVCALRAMRTFLLLCVYMSDACARVNVMWMSGPSGSSV